MSYSLKNKTLKVGVIGNGYIANYHAEKINKIDDLEITACYDKIPEKTEEYSKKYGAKVCKTLNEFLNSGVDLALICTTNEVHSSLSIKCLEAGINVMCEKPVTLNSEELEKVIAAAQKSGKLYTSHQNRRWDKDFLVVKSVVESGMLGNITSVYSRMFGQRGVCFGWRADSYFAGGMLYDWGPHMADQILQLFKGQKVVNIFNRMQQILTPSVDDHFNLQLGFEDNKYCVIEVGTFCLQHMPRWHVFGDRGTLTIDNLESPKGTMARIRRDISGFDTVFIKKITPAPPSRIMAPLLPEYIEQLELPVIGSDGLAYHRNLAAAVRGIEAPYVTSDDMRRVMKVLDLARLSAEKLEIIKETV